MGAPETRRGFIRRMLDGSTGAVLWRGPSLLDGRPLIVVASSVVDKLTVANSKTGDVVQTWIVREDFDPGAVIGTDEDRSYCGDCKLRGAGWGKRECYVHLGMVGNMWRSYHRSFYREWPTSPAIEAALLAGRVARFGSYGDPAFVPSEIWRPFQEHCRGAIGYTHQWRDPPQPDLQRFLMASVDTPKERAEARARGWRTFRVRRAWEPLLPGEIACPATPEGGKKTTCEKCRLCDGKRGPGDRRRDVAAFIHGTGGAKYKKWENVLKVVQPTGGR